MVEYPRLLYRYQAFGSEYSMLALQKIFEASELFWITPKDMNDPFDSWPALRLPKPNDFHAYVRRISMSYLGGLSRNDRRAVKADLLAKLRAGGSNNLTSAFRDFINNTSMLCMTPSNNSLLMWSHYANSHKGYCLEFENIWDDLNYIPFFVTYHEQRPMHDLLNGDMRQDFIKVFNSKSIVWQYENEVRFFCQYFSRGYNPFPRRSLKAVYMGCNISNQNRDFLVSLVNKYRKDVNLFQAKINNDIYDLDFVAV